MVAKRPVFLKKIKKQHLFPDANKHRFLKCKKKTDMSAFDLFLKCKNKRLTCQCFGN